MPGWLNDAKIAALARQEHDLATRISAHAAQIVMLKREVDDDNNVYRLWQQLAVYVHFAELDWKSLVASIDLLCTTRKQLRSAMCWRPPRCHPSLDCTRRCAIIRARCSIMRAGGSASWRARTGSSRIIACVRSCQRCIPADEYGDLPGASLPVGPRRCRQAFHGRADLAHG